MNNSKTSVLQVRMTTELKESFLNIAEQEDRPAAQIMRELMKGYIQSRQQLGLSFGSSLEKKVLRKK